MLKINNSVIKYQAKLSMQDFKVNSSLLIYDIKLKKYPQAHQIIKKFPLRYAVQGGESLKDIRAFPKHVEKILKLLQNHNQKNLQIVALGGGSIGDFAGFFASVFKRGTKLCLIPSTWLSALDSAHGGKNGLNVAHLKNQVGTFYIPENIYIVRSLLKNQPPNLLADAAGELLKIALIEGEKLWKQVEKIQRLDEKQLWKILPLAVESKYRIVQEDPMEEKGYRQILNFGHTLGHVIEAKLGVSHGNAVGQGLVFATEWSHQLGFLGPQQYQIISKSSFYETFYAGLQMSLKKLTLKQVESALMMDKKKDKKDDLYFIFPVRPGLCIRHTVKIKKVVQTFLSLKKSISS